MGGVPVTAPVPAPDRDRFEVNLSEEMIEALAARYGEKFVEGIIDRLLAGPESVEVSR